jgi:ABC-type glycerol-3-phosphate transport system substrate-binding protein
MKMKHLKGIALAAAAVVGLAACGGSSESSDTTAAGSDYSNLTSAFLEMLDTPISTTKESQNSKPSSASLLPVWKTFQKVQNPQQRSTSLQPRVTT